MAIRPTPRTDVNRSAVLAQLGAQGPASRADLARVLRVSPALMTQLTKDLLADGLIVELEHSPSQGGRPARMLGLATSAGRAIGVKVVADHVAFVEVGLDGAVVRSASEPFDATAPTLLADLASLFEHFIAGGGSDASRSASASACPGAVDRQGNGVVDSTQLGWNQVPLGETLRRALDLPVIVENNVNALAMAERLYGVGRRHDSFLVVTIGTGVGAGIVVDGVVLRGVERRRRRDRAHARRRRRPALHLRQHRMPRGDHRRGGAACDGPRPRRDRARCGNRRAARAAADAGTGARIAIFGEAGHLLGRTLAGIVQTVDPELVIVLGEGTMAWPHWAFGFEPAFRGRLLPAARHRRRGRGAGRTRDGRRAPRRSCLRPRSTRTASPETRGGSSASVSWRGRAVAVA